MKLNAPFVNLNGNSKKDIQSQIKDIVKSLNNCIDAVIKADYNNGRNSIDNNHKIKMDKDKAELTQLLKEYKNSYIEMFKEIN